MKVQDVLSNELREILGKQSQKENEAIMREMAKFGGEPSEEWLFSYDADGLYVNPQRVEMQK